jgi:hypothetical protein
MLAMSGTGVAICSKNELKRLAMSKTPPGKHITLEDLYENSYHHR